MLLSVECRLLDTVFHAVYFFGYRRAQCLNLVLSLWGWIVLVCLQHSEVLRNIAEELIWFHIVVSFRGSFDCPFSERGVFSGIALKQGRRWKILFRKWSIIKV